jgi:coenzyme F420-reducing hydrogenase beta subunit
MIQIKDKSQCCGCWACENICPKHCIEMKPDHEGFLYPQIKQEVCIDCGLCEKVCPNLGEKQNDTLPIKHYIIQNKNKEELRKSNSGGFFSVISGYAIQNQGVVFGASFDDKMELRHTHAETITECYPFRGSKYVQSQIKDNYKKAKKFLEQGKLTVFSGTPCQIAGLKSYLRKDYENLITVDLVCRGVPSPLLLKKYLEYHSKEKNSPIINYLSRDKYYGYSYSTASIFFKNKNKSYHKGMESDAMLRLYFKNICSRPSCYQCHYKTIHRISDFTIFDCWDAPSTSKEFSNKGATNVFIHTPKGKAIFEEIKQHFIFHTENIYKIIKRDGIMIKNTIPMNPHRKQFFQDLNQKTFKKLINEYLPESLIRKILANIKPILYYIGIFDLYLKIKRSIT